MSRAVVSPIYLMVSLAALCATPLLAGTPDSVKSGGITLKDASIAFPASDHQFPGGAPAEAINNNCLLCHSASMVLNQPHLAKDEWEKEVIKMKKVYGAPVSDADVPAIVAYLADIPESK